MKITEVTTVLLRGPSTDDPYLSVSMRLRRAAFVEVRTDTPHVGVGETYLGYFIPEIVPALVDFFKPILVGAEALDIHTLCRRMADCCSYWGRVGVGPAVISGIEAALWDLKVKLLGLPVYELLGGKCHDRLPAYATGGPSNWPLEKLLAKVDFYLGLGFRAFKLATGYYDEHGREPSGLSRGATSATMCASCWTGTWASRPAPSAGTWRPLQPCSSEPCGATMVDCRQKTHSRWTISGEPFAAWAVPPTAEE